MYVCALSSCLLHIEAIKGCQILATVIRDGCEQEGAENHTQLHCKSSQCSWRLSRLFSSYLPLFVCSNPSRFCHFWNPDPYFPLFILLEYSGRFLQSSFLFFFYDLLLWEASVASIYCSKKTMTFVPLTVTRIPQAQIPKTWAVKKETEKILSYKSKKEMEMNYFLRINILFIVLLISRSIINVPYYLFISFYLAWHWSFIRS